MGYPYDPSWGYQLVGYFAPTSRFGNPQELVLVDRLHQAGMGLFWTGFLLTFQMTHMD
jgi:1,4-alpha-glucan branching enzyme